MDKISDSLKKLAESDQFQFTLDDLQRWSINIGILKDKGFLEEHKPFDGYYYLTGTGLLFVQQVKQTNHIEQLIELEEEQGKNADKQLKFAKYSFWLLIFTTALMLIQICFTLFPKK